MFYDLEDPVSFAVDIERTLDDEGIWVFEQSYLPSMLETNSSILFAMSTWSFMRSQIIFILDCAGLKVLDVELNDINGGSFSVTAAKKGSHHKVNEHLIANMLEKETMMGLDQMTYLRRS